MFYLDARTSVHLVTRSSSSSLKGPPRGTNLALKPLHIVAVGHNCVQFFFFFFLFLKTLEYTKIRASYYPTSDFPREIFERGKARKGLFIQDYQKVVERVGSDSIGRKLAGRGEGYLTCVTESTTKVITSDRRAKSVEDSYDMFR